MRTLELGLWIVAAGWMTWWRVGVARRPGYGAFLGIALPVGVLHATFEGGRVQMIPTYALVAGMSMYALYRLRHERRRLTGGLLGGARTLAVAAWAAIAAVLPSIFPVYSYDAPAGRFAIGTAIYELHHGPDDRNLVVQAWYPAAAAAGPAAGITTHPRLLQNAYGAFAGLPAALFDNLRLVKTHATVDAPFASSPDSFPVVLFSHGPLGANRSQSIFQMEALASSGFVTFAIDHTGYASTTIFPDGHAVPPGPDAAWPVFVDARSTRMLQTWVKDVQFVLDALDALNAHDARGQLTGRLDLSRVGYVGASFGGSVVVQALLDEPRIRAGVAEDGKPYFAANTPRDLRRPLLYLQSAEPYIRSTDAQLARWNLTQATFKTAEQDHYARQMQLFGQTQSPIYNVFIGGTNHTTFSDLGLLLRLPNPLMDVRRAHRIINQYTVAFLNRYLNGVDDPLVDGSSPAPYTDVTVASRNIANREHLAQMSPP